MSPNLVTTIERPVITPIAYEYHIYVDPVVLDFVQEETVTTNAQALVSYFFFHTTTNNL